MTDRSHASSLDHSRTSEDPARVQRSLDPLARRQSPSGNPPAATVAAAGPSADLAVQMFADAIGAGRYPAQVQLDGTGGGLSSAGVHRAAAHGLSGTGGSLPHLGAIQRSFGRHDVSTVQAHVGGRAAEGAGAMGARAYAAGSQVAFASSPDVHLAAHEAAHVVQQRGGVQLSGGVGTVGDPYERHADAVADLVVQGKSAESLLDAYAPSAGTASSGVQRAVQMDMPAGTVSAPRRRGGAATPPPPSVGGEGEGSIHFAERTVWHGRAPIGPYVFFTGAKLRGNITYHAHYRPEGGGEGHGEEHAEAHGEEHSGEHEEPSTMAHAGLGGSTGAHGGVALEAGIEHNFCDLFMGMHFAGAVESEVSSAGEAHVGISANLGRLRIGDVEIPMPTAELHLIDISPEHGVRLLVGEIVQPIAGTRFSIEVPGAHVEIEPTIDLLLEFEPNWTNLAPLVSSEAEAIAAEGATAVETAEAAGAGAETLGAISGAAEGEMLAAVGIEALLPVAAIVAPIAIGAFMFGMFEHDIARHEEVYARANGNAHTVFNYCIAYTSAWCGTGDMAGAMGMAEGARDAHADMERVRSQHPGADTTALAQRWGGPQAIYNTVHGIIGPLAGDWLVTRTAAEGNDEEVIRACIRRVGWMQDLFRHFWGGAAGG